MSSSRDDLPAALPSLWRTVKLGYRAEPKLLLAAFGMTIVSALPDVLVALWLRMLADAVTDGDRTRIFVAAIGLGVSATGTWYVRVVFDRLQRRFRDRVGIVLESHVARLQASVATIEHHERPEYLDRLAVLRDQVFALDHLFLSLFSTVRQADRICVVEHGRVVELGTHEELMRLGGRYRTMFDLQASRFVEVDEHGEEVVHEQLA